jgi:hypothetical protein
MAGPKFERYVSPVKGRLVSRWDSLGSNIGARVTTPEQRAAGADPVIWDEELVLGLTEQFCARFNKELRQALRNGDLKERNEDDYRAWLEVAAKREAEHVAALQRAAQPASTDDTGKAGKRTK